MQKKSLIALSIGAIFIIGAGAIVYYGRPVMQLEDTDTSSTNTEKIDNDDAQNADGKSDGANTNENVETSLMTSQDQNTTDENDENQDTPPPTPDTPNQAPTTSNVANTYTSAQVATHNTESNCWASVGGNVYDLTSWVSRHPGGSKAIISLCGIDATTKFEAKHGGSSAAKAALVLLKIGTLVE